MSITKFLTEVNNVQALDDEPNDVTGLTAAQLKGKFDKAGADIKDYINASLSMEIDAKNDSSDISITNANNKSDNAVSVANSADAKADNAVTVSSGANTKADNAVASSTNANTKADNAVTIANESNGIAVDAKATAEQVRTEFNNIILDQIPSDSINETKMANDMKKIAGGVAKFDDLTTLQSLVTSNSANNAKQVPHLGTTTNSGDAYSITTSEIIDTNEKFTIKFNANSTTTPTLKINSGTAYAIKKANGNNAKLYASVYTLFWDGTSFIQLGEGGDYGTATPTEVLTGSTIGTDNGVVTGTLALTGTALVTDIVSGKTAYSTDAKTKIIGTATVKSLGGRRSLNGSFTGKLYNASVTSLSFTPSIVILRGVQAGTNYKSLTVILDYSLPYALYSSNYNQLGTTTLWSGTTAQQLSQFNPVPSISMLSNGFSVGGCSNETDTSITWYWIAIE